MIIDFHTHAFPDKVAEKAIPKLAGIGGIDCFGDGTVGRVFWNELSDFAARTSYN